MPKSKKVAIPLKKGESWWGGAVYLADGMPFGQGRGRFDLKRVEEGNQAAPLLVSNAGRYFWSDSPFEASFGHKKLQLSFEKTSTWILANGREGLRGAYLSASKRHFKPSGQMPHPLMFSRPQYNTWIEMQYEPTQEKVLAYATDILKQGYPPGVLMIDDNWMNANGDWTFHPGRFPDPKRMFQRLHRMGFRVMLWLIPFVSPDSVNFRLLRNKNFLVRRPNGEPAIRSWWNGHSGILDVTNPGAAAWLHEQLRKLKKLGADGFKLDGGDPFFYRDDDVSYRAADTQDHCQAWAKIGLAYSMNEYRACWKMGGQALGQRQHDRNPSWRDLARLIPVGLAQGLLGHPYHCPDMVGGGMNLAFKKKGFKVDEELFVRWSQVSALFPMMQFSLAPWRVLGKKAAALCLETAKIHMDHAQELLRLARSASRTGEPIMRSMDYCWPGQGYEKITDQFVVGDSLLVAPVLKKGARRRRVSLPEGDWASEEGKIYHGGRSIWVEAPLSRLPRFRRCRP